MCDSRSSLIQIVISFINATCSLPSYLLPYFQLPTVCVFYYYNQDIFFSAEISNSFNIKKYRRIQKQPQYSDTIIWMGLANQRISLNMFTHPESRKVIHLFFQIQENIPLSHRLYLYRLLIGKALKK